MRCFVARTPVLLWAQAEQAQRPRNREMFDRNNRVFGRMKQYERLIVVRVYRNRILENCVMTNNFYRTGISVFSLLTLAATAGSLGAEEINREFHQAFDVEPGMILKLKHGDGDVTITPWEQSSLDVQVRYRAKTNTAVGWSSKVDLDVDFSQEGNTIYVVGKEPSMVSLGISSFREFEYTYTIQAPSYLQLDLVGEDGDVAIEKWTGELQVNLEDGDVRLTSIRAPRTEILLEDGDLEISGLEGELLVVAEDGDLEIFDCKTAHGKIRVEDGDIDLERCSGSFELRADDGDIRLSRLAADEVDIRVADGSVDLTLLPSEALNLSVRSGDGDVDVSMDAAVSAAFSLETRDGKIRVNASSVENLLKERGRVSGILGDGNGNIHISSVDGDITLRQ